MNTRDQSREPAGVPRPEEALGTQLYDSTMRRWAESNLPVVVSWLDGTIADLPPESFVKQPASFTLAPVHADLLVAIAGNRLMHVEYERSPGQGLVQRMLGYRARIMKEHPGRILTQHVIVLGKGRVRGHDDPANGFTLDLRVVYLRERDPVEFLKDPVLAPLAVLGKGAAAQREASLAAAFILIQESGHPRTGDLLQTAEALATIWTALRLSESGRRAG